MGRLLCVQTCALLALLPIFESNSIAWAQPLEVVAVGPASAATGALSCIEIGVSSPVSNWIFGDGFESGDTAAWGTQGTRFSMTSILDLAFEIRFEGSVRGERVVHLKMVTPRGHHYQTLTAPISSSSRLIGSSRAVDGFPRPLPIQVLSGSESGVGFLVPVAGTPIISSALLGRWTIEAFLDGEIVPCAAAVFELVR